MSLAMSARPSMTSRLEFLLRTLSMHFARYAVSFVKDCSARLSLEQRTGFKLDFCSGRPCRYNTSVVGKDGGDDSLPVLHCVC